MNIAQYIDHTLLKPDATLEQIVRLCEEAKQYGFYSVCVNPIWVDLCQHHLAGSNIKVCSVVGFPFGATKSYIKIQEAREAFVDGADEIDMVMNIGALKRGNKKWGWDFCKDNISEVRRTVSKVILKIIIEACLLTDEEKIKACQIAEEAGADFVKTSTGFGASGATVQDVRLMRQTVGDRLGVKAAGGIRTYKMAKALIDAGANRLGCSNSVSICVNSWK